jgi:radical SAM superfamily enzyme YgiQ (UPF0313 family)
MEKLDALLVRLRNLNHFTRNYQEDEQLGLLYIASHCREKGGYAVSVLDEYNISPDLIKRTRLQSEAKVIGFFCDHENIWAVLQAVRMIKQEAPETLCVLGGPQVSAAPWDERVFQSAPVDVVVVREGEHTFLEILSAFLKGTRDFSGILGIVYHCGEDLVATSPRPLEENLDLFPSPDRSLNYYGKKADGSENLITGRGCPCHCAFCFEGSSVGYRMRSVQSVLEEVEMLLRDRKMMYLAILDDLFTTDEKRVVDICDGFKRLQEKYHRFAWFCEGRVDVISRHPQIAKSLHEAGCIRLQIGVESGNQEILDAYRKGITLDQIRECVDICYEADILSVIGNVIIGGALENRETLEKTKEFACELMARAPGCYDFNTTIFTPYPGTAMFERPEDYGLRIIDRDCLTGMGDNYAFAESESLSKWEILDARHNLMEAFEAVAKALVPRISEERRLRHFRVFYLYGIQTIWMQVMGAERRLFNYYGLQVGNGKRTVGSVGEEEMRDLKPIRTVNIGSSVDGHLILPFLDRPVKMGRLGGKILELCCGKVTIAQIVNHLYEALNGEADRQNVEQYVRATLHVLDEHKLVLLSEL